MRSITVAVSVCLAIVLAASTHALAGSPRAVKAFDPARIDASAKPCVDFNRYANGAWLDAEQIPGDRGSWGAFDLLYEQNLTMLREILERASKADAPAGTAERLIGDYYASVMNQAQCDAAGLEPVRPLLDRVEAIKDRSTLENAIVALSMREISAPFAFGSGPDAKSSTMVIAIAGQGGLGLPDRDYYLKDDDASKKIRDAYVAHVAKMLELGGVEPAKTAAGAGTVMAFETRLAKASLSAEEQRNPEAIYHMMTADERRALTPHFDWNGYLAAVGLAGDVKINVAEPAFFQEVDRMLVEVPAEQWRVYLRWRVLNAMANTLTTTLSDQNFAFRGVVLQGLKEQSPRWKRAINATDATVPDAVGQVYVRETFSPAAKDRMREMVRNLKATMRERLERLSWMSEATRRKAIAKLDAMREKIGYPDTWKDYKGLVIDRGAWGANAMRFREYDFRDTMRRVGKPVDRAEWLDMSPATVSAGYNPLSNDITFPAAILRPPFFNPDADDAINYGAIGAVIGHEITHGFDDEGSQFDADGNLTNWWAPDDRANFDTRAKCTVDQYGGYLATDGTRQNGKLVAGESIADLGGLTIAYYAYQKSLAGKTRPAAVDGFTPEQRFFLGYAQVWAEKSRPEYERLQVTTDPHPLGRFRLNGTVTNMPEFFRAFACGAAPTETRCGIW
jgi:putative endopeptidase